jgi:hypothetical protein
MIASDGLRAALMILFWAAVSLHAPIVVFQCWRDCRAWQALPVGRASPQRFPRIVPDKRLPVANAARSFTTEASVVIGLLLSAWSPLACRGRAPLFVSLFRLKG